MLNYRWFAPAVLIALAGCITYNTRSDGAVRGGLGETVSVDGLKVTPLKVLEDSRCPATLQCVWAGSVRLSARVDLGQRSDVIELTLAKPSALADGSLTLTDVFPAKKAGVPIYPDEYRFAFKFAGGL